MVDKIGNRLTIMSSGKAKIRISSIVLLIIDNDCQAFGFISKENNPNRNGFFNKLIPNLLEARKARRNKIEPVLHDDFGRNDSEAIYEAVNTIIDQVYFEDEETERLDSSFWLGPDSYPCPDNTNKLTSYKNKYFFIIFVFFIQMHRLFVGL